MRIKLHFPPEGHAAIVALGLRNPNPETLRWTDDPGKGSSYDHEDEDAEDEDFDPTPTETPNDPAPGDTLRDSLVDARRYKR